MSLDWKDRSGTEGRSVELTSVRQPAELSGAPVKFSDGDDDDDDLLDEGSGPSVFQVIGTNSQVLNIQLQPRQKVLCEPRVFLHADPGIKPTTKCFWSCARQCSGESQFVTRFRNSGKVAQIVGLCPTQPNSKIVPVDLDDEFVGNRLHCLKGAWLATLGKAHVSFDVDCRPLTCCFGGTGLRRQVIEGSGTVFLAGGGTILRREMDKHERVVLDDHALLAWSGTVSFASRASFDRCTDCLCDCSGEGAFNFVVTGGERGGVIFIQSMPFPKFKTALITRHRAPG